MRALPIRARVGALLLAAPLALVACGGGGGKSATTVTLAPTASVRQAARKTATATSQHMTLEGSLTTSGQAFTISGDGDFDRSAGSMHLDFKAGGLSGGIDAILAGKLLYLRSPLVTAGLPRGKTWLRLDLGKAARKDGLDLSTLAAQDPAQTLAQLKHLKNVKEIGSQQVDGVDTNHYRGRVSRQSAATITGPVDVWIGKDDGYVHRVQVTTSSGSTSRLQATVDLSDFGKNVTVKPPSAAETFDATTLSIPGLGG